MGRLVFWLALMVSLVLSGTTVALAQEEAAAGEVRVIELEADAALRFLQDGEQVQDIPVVPGETVLFRIVNTAGFDLSFWIGSDGELSAPWAQTEVGIPAWRDGVRELEWVVPDGLDELRFGDTVPGHYVSMYGCFSEARHTDDGRVERLTEPVACTTDTVAVPMLQVTGQFPTPRPDGSGLRLELIGYGAAITLPAEFAYDQSGHISTGPLHSWSPFFDESQMRAIGPGPIVPNVSSVSPYCGLVAYSQARCTKQPLDLAEELGATGPLEPVQLPAGDALAWHLERETVDGDAHYTSTYWLTDGTDIYRVWCSGLERPADDWRSIAETFEFPARLHHAESPTADSDLLGGVEELFLMQGGVGLAGPPWPEDYWGQSSARVDIEGRLGADWVDGPELAAMEEHFGTPFEPTDYVGRSASFVSGWGWTIEAQGGTTYPEIGAGDAALVVDGIRMPGRQAHDVRDGLIAWAEVEWERDEAGAAAFEDFPIAGRDVWRVTFADSDAVEYLYAQGDSAIRLHGLDVATDHHAIRLFEALSCHHLPSKKLEFEWKRERLFGPSDEASEEDR